MNLVERVITNPRIWDTIQKVLNASEGKMELYRSVIKNGGKLLDLGCANGNTFPAFRDFEYYGCDINRELIKSAKQKFKQYKNAHFFSKDILRGKFPVSKFDSILFAGTGHHLNDETLLKIFHKLPSLLKPGGIIYYFDLISLPESDSFTAKLLIMLDQGKFVRTLDQFSEIKKNLPRSLSVNKQNIYTLKKTLIDAPKFFYWQIKNQK